jgi:hypothetical protein
LEHDDEERRHSGLDPESRKAPLDSGLRRNDGLIDSFQHDLPPGR